MIKIYKHNDDYYWSGAVQAGWQLVERFITVLLIDFDTNLCESCGSSLIFYNRYKHLLCLSCVNIIV